MKDGDPLNVYVTSDHRTRERLLESIKDRPGVSFSKLMRALNLNEGTLRYHLRYLERKDLISSKRLGTKRVYFSSASPTAMGTITELTREQTRVLNVIRKYPGIGSKDILRSTELSRKGLKQIILKLKREHLIWEIKNGNGLGYEVITRMRMKEEMLVDLAERFLKDEIDQSTFIHLKEWMEEGLGDLDTGTES